MEKFVRRLIIPLYILSIIFIEVIICSMWLIWYYVNYDLWYTITIWTIIIMLMLVHYIILWRATNKNLLGKAYYITFLIIDIVIATPLLIICISNLRYVNIIFTVIAETFIILSRLISSIIYFFGSKNNHV